MPWYPTVRSGVIFSRICVYALLLLASLLMAPWGRAEPAGVTLSPEESAWVSAHRETVFSVGFDPYSGMDVFDVQGKRTGFLPALLDDMEKHLGLRFALADVQDWGDAYQGFEHGRIDVLYGANVTPERLERMVFSRPAKRHPYVVMAHKGSAVQTLGDLDGKRIGFIANDFVSEQLAQEYRNITYQAVNFVDQEQALKALTQGKIDGFITSGGGVERDFLFRYPDLAVVAELPTITSDMTFSVLWESAILARIIDKYIDQRKEQIYVMAKEAERTYTRKVLRLSNGELEWLEHKGEVVVGVADDYLPFDYYANGEYLGIVGETLRRIADIIGFKVKVVHGPFAEIYEKAKAGTIDVLNIAKTEDRLQYFLYPRPLSTERDIILGQKTSPPVQDVYGLEGSRVAVIEGFWHEEYLRKNLKHPIIVRTEDIIESLRMLHAGKVDYLIENPTVAEYYVHGLGFSDLVKRGSTSKDSFVYFGVNRQHPEIASIIDKALSLINFEDMKYIGMQSVPTLQNEESRQLVGVVVGLVVALFAILFITVRIVRSLVEQKAQTRFFKEREELLYTDRLTGFRNRNYLSDHADQLVKGVYPQAIVVADLNNLKQINDRYGHAAGDAVLHLFAAYLCDRLPHGQFFRVGGDEFLVIINDSDEASTAEAVAAIEQLCQSAGHTLDSGEIVYVSAAIGYAIRRRDRDTLDQFIAAADERMYEVKAGMKKRRTDQATAGVA